MGLGRGELGGKLRVEGGKGWEWEAGAQERVCALLKKSSHSPVGHRQVTGTQRGCAVCGVTQHPGGQNKEDQGREDTSPSPTLTSDTCPTGICGSAGEYHLWKWEGPEQLFRATDSSPHPGFNQDLTAQDHNNDIMLNWPAPKAHLGPAVHPQPQPDSVSQAPSASSQAGGRFSPKGTALPTEDTLMSHARA